MIDPCLDLFCDELPPVDVSDEVFARVGDIVRYAGDSVFQEAAEQIQALTKVAAAELI
jgi:hypothetical protein